MRGYKELAKGRATLDLAAAMKGNCLLRSCGWKSETADELHVLNEIEDHLVVSLRANGLIASAHDGDASVAGVILSMLADAYEAGCRRVR